MKKRLCTTRRVHSELVLTALLAVLALASPGSSNGIARAQDEFEPVYLPLVMKGHPKLFPPVPTAASTPTTTLTPSVTPTPTVTVTPSTTPTVGPSPTFTTAPTETPSTTPTTPPTDVPTPTETVPAPAWQEFVNYHRSLARLPGVAANDDWSRGGELHSKYMVKNDQGGHSESPGNTWYTKEGHEAAQNGNVMLTSDISADHEDAINMWMVGPFHMLGIIDPRLETSGYGQHAEDIGTFKFGATLDVLRGRGSVPSGVRYPVYYPADGLHIPNLAYGGGESPDPLVTCTGYRVPTGPPIALQLGTGGETPRLGATSFKQGDTELDHCVYDETSYTGSLGKAILNSRDAIVMMPKATLKAGQRYTVSMEVSGESYEWSFTAGAGTATLQSRTERMPAPPAPTR